MRLSLGSLKNSLNVIEEILSSYSQHFSFHELRIQLFNAISYVVLSDVVAMYCAGSGRSFDLNFYE